MVKTVEEKKKDILDYLYLNSKKSNWFSLSNKAVIEKFSDEEFDQQDILDILDKLEKQNRTNKYRISFKINFPRIFKKIVKKTLKHYVETPRFILIFLGFYSLVGLTTISGFYQFLQSKFGAKTAPDFFIIGALIGIIGSYSIGFVIDRVYRYFEDKIPLLYQNKDIITPILFIAIVSLGVVILYSILFSKPIEIGHVIAIITISILGGFAHLGYRKKLPAV